MIFILFGLYMMVGFCLAEEMTNVTGDPGPGHTLTIIATWIGLAIVWPLLAIARVLYWFQR